MMSSGTCVVELGTQELGFTGAGRSSEDLCYTLWMPQDFFHIGSQDSSYHMAFSSPPTLSISPPQGNYVLSPRLT